MQGIMHAISFLWQETTLIVVFGIALLVILVHRARVIHDVGGKQYVISMVSKSPRSFEYRLAEAWDWLSWTAYRGNVKLYQEDGSVRAVDLRAECTPLGDMWAAPCGEPRDATPDELRMFGAVFG